MVVDDPLGRGRIEADARVVGRGAGAEREERAGRDGVSGVGTVERSGARTRHETPLRSVRSVKPGGSRRGRRGSAGRGVECVPILWRRRPRPTTAPARVACKSTTAQPPCGRSRGPTPTPGGTPRRADPIRFLRGRRGREPVRGIAESDPGNAAPGETCRGGAGAPTEVAGDAPAGPDPAPVPHFTGVGRADRAPGSGRRRTAARRPPGVGRASGGSVHPSLTDEACGAYQWGLSAG